MYSREDKDQLPAQPATPGARGCPVISTERIMQAVEEQRRVSQQLEDLRLQQKQRTAHLSSAGLKFIGVLWCVSGALAGGFILLLIMIPALLDRTLNSLDDSIAVLVMLAEQIKLELALIPSSNWMLSAAALVVVLMMGLWIRLMRHPQDG
ncbi:MAG TPA: hypothetical protein VGM01_14025 [Ktedonobacteraceae bacterium]